MQSIRQQPAWGRTRSSVLLGVTLAMALLAGGGYAEEAVVHAGSALVVPEVFSDEEAGAFPEVFLTAFLNIFMLGEPPANGWVLVHGGGSGVGTAAITLCREAGLRVVRILEAAQQSIKESGNFKLLSAAASVPA